MGKFMGSRERFQRSVMAVALTRQIVVLGR